MVKFEPEVAYRILAEKQRRLYDRSAALLRERIDLELRGELSYYGRLWRGWEITSLDDEADGMWDVLDYLRNRIEEERNDSIQLRG